MPEVIEFKQEGMAPGDFYVVINVQLLERLKESKLWDQLSKSRLNPRQFA